MIRYVNYASIGYMQVANYKPTCHCF